MLAKTRSNSLPETSEPAVVNLNARYADTFRVPLVFITFELINRRMYSVHVTLGGAS